MKTFAFRLERVLRWRQAQLDLEQFTLGRLAADCARWDAVLAGLERTKAATQESMLTGHPIQGRELEALARYQEHLQKQKQIALERRAECERKMEEQRGRVLSARRAYRLLEKLRGVRHAEWEAAVNREFEALAAETYLARWKR